MLTTHQKELLTELESEFSKMNQSETTKSDLVQELLDEINVERKGLRELSAYNEKVLELYYETLKKDIEEFKEFYAKDGIILDVEFDFFKGAKHCKNFRELLEFDNPKNSQDVAIRIFVKKPKYTTYSTKYYVVYRPQYCGGRTFYKAYISKDYRSLLEKSIDCSIFRRFLKSILESA